MDIQEFREARQKLEEEVEREVAHSTWIRILPAFDKIQELTNQIEATMRWARVEIFKSRKP